MLHSDLGLAYLGVIQQLEDCPPKEGRLEFMGIRRANELQCPKCGNSVSAWLVRHR